MQLIKLSEATAARRRVPVALVDDTDGKTAETGVTLSAGDMKISKAGGAEANHAGTLTELAAGDYYYEFAAAELDTLGYITGRIIKSGVRTFRIAAQVVAFDPYDVVRLGLTSIPNVVQGNSGQLALGDASGRPTVAGYATGQAPLQPTTAGRTLDIDVDGNADVNVVEILGAAPTVESSFDANIIAVTGTPVTAISDFKSNVTVATAGIGGGGIAGPALIEIANQVRDISNATPAAGSLGESINDIPGSAMTLADGAITDAKITLPTEATGTPSTALQMIMWIAGMFGWRKVIKNSTTIVQYMNDGTTTKTTSTYSSVGATETINKAS